VSIGEASLALLEQAINRYLALDPEAHRGLKRLHGRVIGIDLVGLGQRLYLVPGPAGIQVFGHYEGEPDCVLRGTPLALMRMQDQKGSTEQLFGGQVEIEGDTELGHRFGKFLGSLDIDWEEQLSHLTGDVVAHRLGSLVRRLTDWGGRSAHTLGKDLQEYLQEEARLLPTRYELEGFYRDVDTLRHDVDRLEARIRRLRDLTG